MKRLLCRTFNIATFISTLLFVAVCVLWVRSLRRLEAVRYLGGDSRLVELETHSGGVDVSSLTRLDDAYDQYPALPRSLRPRRGWSASSHLNGSAGAFGDWPDGSPGSVTRPTGSHERMTFEVVYEWLPPPHLFLGFGWENERTQAASAVSSRMRLTFPFWLPLAVLSVIPLRRLLIFGRDRRAVRRTARGLCAACGYDLRGTRGRCPECGTVPTGQAAT